MTVLVMSLASALAEKEPLKEKIKRQLSEPPVVESLEYEQTVYDLDAPHPIISQLHQFARWNSPTAYYLQTLSQNELPDIFDSKTADLSGRDGTIFWSRKKHILQLMDQRHNSPELASIIVVGRECEGFRNVMYLGVKALVPGSVIWNGDQFETLIPRDKARFTGSRKLLGKVVESSKPNELAIHYTYGNDGLLISKLEFDENLLEAPIVFPKAVTVSWRIGNMPFVKECEWKIKSVQFGSKASDLLNPTRFIPTNSGSATLVHSNGSLYYVGRDGLDRMPTVEEQNGEAWYQRFISALAVGLMFVGFLLLKRVFNRRMTVNNTQKQNA